jgi:uncharacterized membrane protein
MSPAPVAASIKRPRIESVDVLRGVIMVLMALDHIRDFVGARVNPVNLATTTVPLFFTRWITHFCAPVFFLTMGMGAYFALGRRSKPQLSRFLLTRGLWLIFLELVPLRCLGFQFNFDYRVTMLFILWALGWAMIILSALIYLPEWAIITCGVVAICGHNLLDRIDSRNPLFVVLHSPGGLFSSAQHTVVVAYALVPWFGVTAVGYGMGRIFSWEAERRRQFLLRLGIALSGAFVVLRAINVYGDPNPWSVQKSAAFTVLAFLNTVKYPPSLLFLLMTLGPALIALALLDGKSPRLLRPALIVGRVPLFYYILHIPLIHLIALIICYARYGHIYWMFQSPDAGNFPFTAPTGWGLSLPWIYVIWAMVVVLLYPLCRWFAGVKQRSTAAWLSYL